MAGEGLAPNGFRLYTDTFSDYFPREDGAIRRDLAARWLTGIQAILQCVQHKITSKAEEVERSRRAFAFMGSVTAILLAPMTGGAGLTTMWTELGGFVTELYLAEEGEAPPVDPGAVGTGIAAAGLVLGGEPGARDLLDASLTKILEALGEDLSPLVKKAFLEGVPKLVDIAIDEFAVSAPAGEALATGQGALGFLNLQSLATGAVSQAVGMAVGAVKAAGVKEVRDFYEIMMDLPNLGEKMATFLLWTMEVLGIDQFLSLLLETLFGAGAITHPMGPIQDAAAGRPPDYSGRCGRGSVGARLVAGGAGTMAFLLPLLAAGGDR